MPDRLPAGYVQNREIGASSTDPITADKIQHLYKQTERFGFKVGDAPTTAEVILFVAEKAGRVLEVAAGLDESGTSTDIDFDLVKRPSTSMLSAEINVVHGTGDRTEVEGTIASDGSYAVGDVVTAKMTVTSATGAAGPWMRVVREEDGD